MLKSFSLSFLMMALLACSGSDGNPIPAPGTGQDDDDIPLEPKENIIFDSEFTGLVELPADSGGQHLARPVENQLSPLGHYIYIPGGYNDNSLDYPLIVFLHGAGERGDSFFNPDDLNKVLTHGPPSLIANNMWNPSFPCLVASPQTSTTDWGPAMVNSFINHLVRSYRVNEARIYLTGLSMGGRGCWSYGGEYGNTGQAVAMVPICGNGNPSQGGTLGQIPIWAFHGGQDNIIDAFGQNGSVPMVESINTANPSFVAKMTLYPGVGHDSWTRTYSGTGMGEESNDYDAFDMSIYDWMFQYRKEN